MTERLDGMSCAAFQEQLPELISLGKSVASHPHLQSCELCKALLADLETIADAARQLLPVADPSDTLWVQIESAIHDNKAV